MIDGVKAVILAGGKSARMGTDKAALRVGGESLLERTVRIATEVFRDCVVIGRTPDADWPFSDIQSLEDEHPDLGPIGGLYTAFRRGLGPVLLLPCDMPALDTQVLVWLTKCAERLIEKDAVVTQAGRHVDPFPGIYYPSIMQSVKESISGNDRSMQNLLRRVRTEVVSLPEEMRDSITNVNTPEEWEKAKRGM